MISGTTTERCLIVGFLFLVCCLWFAAPASSQAPATTTRPRAETVRVPAPSTTPELEPVAETKLLMEGLAQPNFRGVQKLLKQEPADDAAWVFLRGQALLLAETGNLLMLRPPNNAGESLWQERAGELRVTATRLAKAAGSRDYVRSRVALAELSNACNRCHQSFRVTTRVSPTE